MDNRREFLKKAALLSGGTGLLSVFPPSIQKALAIDPAIGTTFMDAEHVVILMQENRSFDHCFGSLQGVRGFDDPRAIHLPNGNPVWLQQNKLGETFAPYRLDIRNTNATFLGSLPHSWPDQTDARNEGLYDQWLMAKARGGEDYQGPFTLGFYNREDLPFYYSLADAFTVCDQNFCSSLTGTTPNRLYLWTGTIRPEQKATAPAHVMNSDTDYDKEVSWKTFPERLEENNISWKIYQNEISLASGLSGEEDAWLANFTDNPIEWFSQYHVRFSPTHVAFLEKMEAVLPKEINGIESRLRSNNLPDEEKKKLQRELISRKMLLAKAQERHQWSRENFEKLPQKEQQLHKKAFTTNAGHPDYRELSSLEYDDNGVARKMTVPKSDPLYQFRKDVEEGKLPTVSWLVGSENFSDHPGAPWYGAWYVSEVMDILTSQPEVWKKTIFILCYDENDGYFDHVPPFVAPNPNKPSTGKVSKDIDASLEFVTLEQDLKMRGRKAAREGSIGLGFRVPLVIASPWSRGGAVCSEVFDHTSILQFLEKFCSAKAGKPIRETNITAWRRAVCGDLTTVFRPYEGQKINLPPFLDKEQFYETIHKAQFKSYPNGFVKCSDEDIREIQKDKTYKSILPRQEKGQRTSLPLRYELYADITLSEDRKKIGMQLHAGNKLHGKKSMGSPFSVYAGEGAELHVRQYALVAGDHLSDQWDMDTFTKGIYSLKTYAPNGFFRGATGSVEDPAIQIKLAYQTDGSIVLHCVNQSDKALELLIEDQAYGSANVQKRLPAKKSADIKLSFRNSQNWYDFLLTVPGYADFSRHYAGRVENGSMGMTDPQIGR